MAVVLLFTILICFGLLIESALISYPIVFITLSLYFLFKDGILFYITALVSGLILDILVFHAPGATTLFLSLFFIFMYIFERVFSILDVRFYLILVFIGAEIYRAYAGYAFEWVTSGSSFMLLMILGIILSRYQGKEVKHIYE